jgi:hypothetical protein
MGLSVTNSTLFPDPSASPVQFGLRCARHNAEIIGLFAVAALLVTAPITVAALTTAALAVVGAAAFGFVFGYGVGILARPKSHDRSDPGQNSALEL